MTADKTYMMLKEAADWYGVSERTLRRRIAEGRLPAYRVGPRSIRVLPADIAALATRIPAADPITAQTQPPKPAEPTGLCAVIVDVDGALYVRKYGHAKGCRDWFGLDDSTTPTKYADIAAVKVLFKGVVE